MISVVIADDHGVVRAGLEQLLATYPNLDVVGLAADGLEVIHTVDEVEPDVVLMDLRMPNVDGIEATRMICSRHPETRVVVLTSFSDRDGVLAALNAGAVGYLLKDSEPDELLRGIEAAARGDSPLAPKAARILLDDRGDERQQADGLTEREREVLGLLTTGASNKEIAKHLEISEKTVKTHLGNIFQRIGVLDRTQAALWAERNGVLNGARWND